MTPRIFHDDGTAPEWYVGPPVSKPVLMLAKSIRSEREYQADPNAAAHGLELARRATSCVKGRPFVFFVTPSPELRSSVRTKKGLLWDYPDMKELDARHGEVEADEKYSSLTSLICLEKYGFCDPNSFIGNWRQSVLLVSDLSIDELFSNTPSWVHTTSKGGIPLDFEQMFSDLERLSNTAVLRYLAAYNGRDETIAAVGHENLLNARAIDCLNRLG